MKILVTGGAGFIGSHAVLELLDRGNDVIVFDSLTIGHKEAIERINEGRETKAILIKGNLQDKADLTSLFSNYSFDAVVHFAAFSLTSESVQNPAKYYSNNVCGSLNLFSQMVKSNVKKLVFSSTAAVYGMPEKMPIVEETSTSPVSPYGQTKLMIEQILDDFYDAYRLSSIRLRYFNAAGASSTVNIGEDHDPETHLIPLIFKTVLGQRKNITIFGDDYNTKDGTCIRDYIHVEDLVSAHITALEKLYQQELCEYCNLGSGKGYSVKEIIEKTREITGVFPVKIGERRAGDPEKLIASAKKAKRLLGWEVKNKLGDIISSAWRWHKNNPFGYQKK